jgi:1,4-alpha-glucan branching enzyme
MLIRSILTARLPLYLAISVTLAVASGVWAVQNWRHQARISQLREDVATQMVAIERNARQIEARYRELEQLRQREMEKERENYLRAQQETALALDTARDESDRLRRLIAAERNKARQLAQSSAGNIDAAQAPWVVLEACRREYESVAKDADELANRLRLAAGWSRAIEAGHD